jgi:hypothetical protein
MKVKYSGIITDARGSLGNAVASRNAQGPFFRAKIQPVDRLTSLRISQRNYFANLAKYWIQSSPSIKAYYKTIAPTYTFYDSMSQPYQPSPYQIFMFLSLNCVPIMNTGVLTPIPYDSLYGPLATYGTFVVGTVHWNINSFYAGSVYQHLKISISPKYPSSYGKSKYPMSFVTHIPSTASFPVDIGGLCDAIWGQAGIAGQSFIVYFQTVDTTTGLVSSIQKDVIAFS